MQGIGGGVDVAEVFNIQLWLGDASTREITTNVDSVVDDSLVWIKQRSDPLRNHVLFDTKRGAENFLRTNQTSAEVNGPTTLSAFLNDGYEIKDDTQVNRNTEDYVGWQFKKSAKFFDVIKYVGDGLNRSLPHELGIQAGLAIVKHTDGAGNNDWAVQHIARGGLVKTRINLTDAEIATGNWNSLTMDENNVYLAPSVFVNAAASNYVMYLFAHDPSPSGVIHCGQYTGTGATGVQVDLGWVPQYVMIKSVSITTSDWFVFDTTRGINGTSPYLTPNTSAVEVDTSLIILIATGFEINNTLLSANGADYIYMAIREE